MSLALKPTLPAKAEGPAGERRRFFPACEETARKDALLMSILPDVVFDGWSRAALRRAARGVGLSPAETQELLPGGVVELARWLDFWADRQMAAALRSRDDLAAMKIRDRVALGIRLRLEMLAPHRQAVRKAIAMNCSPLGTLHSLQTIYHTIDTIWRIAGDNATDFNFYTKRGLLAAVYASTLLCWLDDTSEDFKASWAFLDRRIGEVMRIPLLSQQLKNNVRRFFLPFSGRRGIRKSI